MEIAQENNDEAVNSRDIGDGEMLTPKYDKMGEKDGDF